MSARFFRPRILLAIVFAIVTALVLTNLVPDRSRSELARWQSPESRFVTVMDVPTHYRREGKPDGPAVLLLHGTASSLHTWDGWVAALGEHYQLIRLDLPAFGLTGARADDDYSIDAYVAFVNAFAAKVGLDSFVLAGNSLGGNIAWQFALTHPEPLTALVLLDASGFPNPDATPSLAFRLARIPILNNVLTWFAPRSLYERSVAEVYADDSLITESLIDRYYQLSLHEGNRRAFVQRALQWESAPVERLPDITTPTLILWGEQDLWIPPGNARKFAAAIPRATLISYPDVGHVPMEEAPRRTASDVDAFLQAIY